MSIVIYISGEIETTAKEKDLEEVLEIKNSYGEEAFSCKDGVLEFKYSEAGAGHDPVGALVYGPLDELAVLAKIEGFRIDGQIEVSSDWKEYDNISIMVNDQGYRVCNTEILNAGTDELVAELERRGIHVPTTAREDGEKTWTVTKQSSLSSDYVRIKRVRGTEQQVKEYLASLVRNGRGNLPFTWIKGTEKAEDVVSEYGVLSAVMEYESFMRSCSSPYCLYYRAEPEKEPVLLTD